MAFSGILTDYIGTGLAAARPATPNVGPGCLALYRATDTGALSAWTGAAWVTLAGGTVTSVTAGAGLSGGPITAAGTLAADWHAGVVSSISTGLNLAAGVLTATGSGAYVGCRAYNDGTQSISHNTATAVTFGAEEWDTSAIHSTSSNTSRFTVPVGSDGKWCFRWHVNFTANSVGARIIFLRKNGVDDTHNLIGSAVFAAASTLAVGPQGSATALLAAGDYIELFVYQDSGSTVTIGSTIAADRGAACAMEAQYLGA